MGGNRRRWRAANVAIALAGLMFAACTGGSSGSGGSLSPSEANSGSPSTRPSPAGKALLSLRAAQGIFLRYEHSRTRAGAHLSAGMLAESETGPAAAIDRAMFEQLRDQGKSSALAVTYTLDTYDIPSRGDRTDSFLVQARPGPVPSQQAPVFLVFSKQGGAWKVSSIAPTTLASLPPALATTGGVGETVEVTSSKGLLVKPADLSRDLAAYWSSGGKAMKNVFAPGPQTTAEVAADKRREEAGRKHGILARIRFAPTTYDPVAFRTADGAALVIFTVERTDSGQMTQSRYSSGYRLLQDRGRTHYSAFVSPGYYREVTQRSLVQVAAVIPPAGSSTPVDVIGQYPGTISATAN